MPLRLPGVKTLLVVSHVVHYAHDGRLFAYGPYAREVEIWADLVETLVIAAPFRTAAPPGDCTPLDRPNVQMAPLVEAGGDTWRAKAHLIAVLPAVAVALGRAMARADAIHVRCPGSYGLLGAALAPRFSRRVIAKYAGQWNGYAGERWPARVERALLRSRWWHGPVTVYGQWPGEPPHIVPFFTSMMSGAQVEHAAAAAARRQWHRPLRVLFCGLLEPRKRADALIEAVAIAGRRGLSTEVAIVGGGAERATLEQQAHDAGVAHAVRFVGALPFERALEWYEWADCLVLPSQHSEGWPKVVAEAMAYGVLCIAVRHGQLASMLTGRGLLLESGAPPEIAAALARVEAEPAACREMTDAASAWARQYSLEGLRDAIAALLIDRWQLPRSDTPQEMEAPA